MSDRNAVKRDLARAFVQQMISVLRASRDAGALPDIEPEALVMAIAAYGVVAHGAPVIRQMLYGEVATSAAMREDFLTVVRRLVGAPAV